MFVACQSSMQSDKCQYAERGLLVEVQARLRLLEHLHVKGQAIQMTNAHPEFA